MVGALWTGISGLSGAQRALDNESNNIANVNTLGYKASRIAFADQMYQDNIGKGVSTFDVEKLYVQGNLKVTAVGYDMALSGDGFFQVSDGNEFYYSRAGNFRMGEDGNLQNAGGYSVQGWAMSPLQSDDIVSTDGNATKFTNDYNKLLGNTIIRDTQSIETIVAKATDYTETARTDNIDTFTGAGYKTASTKISDVELLITEYNRQLSLHANADPKPTATDSSVQKDLLDYNLDVVDLADGDEMYIYIDGTKYSQTFDTDESTTAKKLADKISNISGFNAYLTDGTSPAVDGTFVGTPSGPDPIIDTASNLGQIVIESIVPGKQFRVTEYGWTDASNANQAMKGEVSSLRTAVQGTGIGAISTVSRALAEAVSGKQSDVYPVGSTAYTNIDGNFASTGIDPDEEYQYTLYKDSFGPNLPPADILVLHTDETSNIPGTPQDIANAINNYDANGTGAVDSDGNGITDDLEVQPDEAAYYLNAYVLNGSLVIEPKEEYYDKEINASLEQITNASLAATLPADSTGVAGTSTAAAGVLVKDSLSSGNRGAAGQFMEITTTINQAARKEDIQLRLDSLDLTDSAFGDFSVDTTGLIIMKQDGVDYAIGQVAVARFTDNRGLDPAGNNLVKSTNRSGQAIFNLDNNKTAEIKGGVLELSTADLSESLVNLMVFQRAFEANAKSITTADQILTTLIALKR